MSQSYREVFLGPWQWFSGHRINLLSHNLSSNPADVTIKFLIYVNKLKRGRKFGPFVT